MVVFPGHDSVQEGKERGLFTSATKKCKNDETEMEEGRLLEKLRALEALHSGAGTDGERVAAAEATRRIRARLEALETEAPPQEYKLTVADPWSMKLLIALCRRYGIKPYRYPRQRHTTLMIRVSGKFLDETLWPEFSELSDALREHLREVTDRVIAEAVHEDTSDATGTDTTPLLTNG